MFLHRHAWRLDKFYDSSLYTLPSSFRQLIERHSSVVFKLVLDIFTATKNFILPSHRDSVGLSSPLQRGVCL